MGISKNPSHPQREEKEMRS